MVIGTINCCGYHGWQIAYTDVFQTSNLVRTSPARNSLLCVYILGAFYSWNNYLGSFLKPLCMGGRGKGCNCCSKLEEVSWQLKQSIYLARGGLAQIQYVFLGSDVALDGPCVSFYLIFLEVKSMY